MYWMPVYLQEGRHFSENEMKAITSLLYVAGGISSFLSGFLSDWLVKRRGLRFGRRFIGMIGLGMGSILFFLSAIITNNVAVAGTLISANFFIVSAILAFFSTCIDIGGNNVGFITGIMNTSGQIAGFLGGIIVGKIVHVTHSFNSPLFVVGAVLFTGSLLWLAVDPNKKLSISDDEKLIRPDSLNTQLVLPTLQKII